MQACKGTFQIRDGSAVLNFLRISKPKVVSDRLIIAKINTSCMTSELLKKNTIIAKCFRFIKNQIKDPISEGHLEWHV